MNRTPSETQHVAVLTLLHVVVVMFWCVKQWALNSTTIHTAHTLYDIQRQRCWCWWQLTMAMMLMMMTCNWLLVLCFLKYVVLCPMMSNERLRCVGATAKPIQVQIAFSLNHINNTLCWICRRQQQQLCLELVSYFTISLWIVREDVYCGVWPYRICVHPLWIRGCVCVFVSWIAMCGQKPPTN